MLDRLQDNGGPTRTHALLPGSLAIERIPTGINGCVPNASADQRGAPCAGGSGKGDDACDSGAYEANSTYPHSTPTPSPTPTSSPTSTPGLSIRSIYLTCSASMADQVPLFIKDSLPTRFKRIPQFFAIHGTWINQRFSFLMHPLAPAQVGGGFVDSRQLNNYLRPKIAGFHGPESLRLI